MSRAAMLVERTAILGFSKLAAQAILFFSPILLVRLLDVAEFGRYREFILYASMPITLLGFSAAGSLPFFVARDPERAGVYTGHVVLFILAASLLGVAGLWLIGDVLRAAMSFDFLLQMQLYIFFTMNFDFLEMYWLATRNPARVLLYSTGRLAARLAAIVIAAAWTHDATSVIWALVIVEGLRCVLVAGGSIAARIVQFRPQRDAFIEQATYFLPNGAGASVFMLNENVGKLLLSVEVGAEALAMFTIGAFGMPIVGIVKSSISEAIFPEMASRRTPVDGDGLDLWRTATAVYAAILFPVAAVFVIAAEEIVTILFTAAYLPSAPVFAVFALWMVVQVFEFHLPLRLLNKNKYYLLANLVALLVNVVFLVPLFRGFGLVGVAVSFVLSQAALTGLLAFWTMRGYGMAVGGLTHWPVIWKVTVATVAASGVLVGFKALVEGSWTVVMVGGLLFAGSYLAVTNGLGVWKISTVRRFVSNWRRRD